MATIANSPSHGGAHITTGNLTTSLYQNNFHKPEWRNFLTFRFPQYGTVTNLLNELGRKEAISQETWNWAEFKRARIKLTITDNSSSPVTTGTPGTTVTVEVDESTEAFIVGDVVELPVSGRTLAVVTATTTSGTSVGAQKLTLEEIDGNNLTDSSFPVGGEIVHRYNINEEGSSAPEGRNWAPDTETGKLATLRRTCKVTDEEYGNKLWFELDNGKAYWYWAQQDITRKEAMLDQENCVMFGQDGTQTSTGAVSGQGIFDRVYDNGTRGTYSGALQEDDLIDFIDELKVHSPASEFIVLAGYQVMSDVRKALKDYLLDGAVTYGSFSEAGMMVGNTINQYQYGDTLLTFREYELFRDPNMRDTSSNGFDYANTLLFLNMANDEAGQPLIKLMTKKDPKSGGDLFWVEGNDPGFAQVFGFDGFSNGGDAVYKEYIYSRIGVEIRAAVQHGILYKA